jgi:hypothetical protein
MATNTFQGIVRSHGGQDKKDTYPGTVVLAAEAVVDGSTSTFAAVTGIGGGTVVLPDNARIMDVTHNATGAADKTINLGTSTSGAGATTLASALSANGYQSGKVNGELGTATNTVLDGNSTIYGAGVASSTLSSTTLVTIYYTVEDNGKPGESQPELS